MSARTTKEGKPAPAIERPEFAVGVDVIVRTNYGRTRTVASIVRRTPSRIIIEPCGGYRDERAFSAGSLQEIGSQGYDRTSIALPVRDDEITDVREASRRDAIAERCRRYAWGELPTPALDAIAQILDRIETRRAEHPA